MCYCALDSFVHTIVPYSSTQHVAKTNALREGNDVCIESLYCIPVTTLLPCITMCSLLVCAHYGATACSRCDVLQVPKADLADPFREKKHKVAVLRQRLDMVVTEMQRLKLMKKDQENAIWQAYSLLINQHRNFTAAYDHYKRAKANVHSTLSAHDIELVHVTMQQEAAKLNEYVHFHHKLLHKWQAVVVMVMDQILNMERHKFRLEREISILQSHMSQLPFVPPPLTSLVTSSQQS